MKYSLLILGATSIVCSGIVFRFLDDPEGPNLLVVLGLAAIMYLVSLAAYFFRSSFADSKKMLMAISIQAVLAIAICAFFALSDSDSKKPAAEMSDFKNIEYVIEGQSVQLKDGFAETPSAPGSAQKVITKYFGNEIKTDLDGDGDEDIAFILTQDPGGSGLFYYAVAALKTDQGYVGSDGYLLGDRIAPQSTTLSQNPRHAMVIVFNYADRALGQPMTEPPRENKSVYLKINPETMRWAIVAPDFEGESR